MTSDLESMPEALATEVTEACFNTPLIPTLHFYFSLQQLRRIGPLTLGGLTVYQAEISHTYRISVLVLVASDAPPTSIPCNPLYTFVHVPKSAF